MTHVELYSKEKKSEWDKFINESRNGHFILLRDFMEYHSDRFYDHSLMFYDDKRKLLGVIPSNLSEDILYAHQGLTFSGLIIDEKVTTPQVLSVFNSMINHCKNNGIRKVVYKRIPDLYCAVPAQDDLYALFINNAKLIRRDVNSVVYLTEKYSYSKGRKWSVNKAKKEQIEVVESEDYDAFWDILKKVLSRHDAIPTHTVNEIVHLRKKLPDNIKLFLAKKDNSILAGTVLFINKDVVHTQYMASTDVGRETGALDFLIHHLMTDEYSKMKYFNFGISTEESGKVLNEGLLAQKNGFGAKSTVYDFYEISI